MNTNFTIGDWVMFDNKPYKVLGVDSVSCCNVIIDMGKKWYDEETFSGDNMKPIPLTEEILKGNGFTYIPRAFHLGIYKLKLYLEPIRKGQSGKRMQTIEFYTAIDGSKIIIASIRGIRRNLYGPIQYVHELQQAFRVCELNDLADNFKIE